MQQAKFRRAQRKAAHTAKWAKVMAKWMMTYASQGRPWHIVAFDGPRGGESTGVVDLLAIRKDHGAPRLPLKRGDLFEIILIQVKGGSAAMPSDEDVRRLKEIGKRYRAKALLLAVWRKGRRRELHELTGSHWEPLDAKARRALFK